MSVTSLETNAMCCLSRPSWEVMKNGGVLAFENVKR
jgi:hypothetical protein